MEAFLQVLYALILQKYYKRKLLTTNENYKTITGINCQRVKKVRDRILIRDGFEPCSYFWFKSRPELFTPT